MGEHGPLGDLPFERLEAGVQLVEVATVPEAVDTMSRVLDDMRALGCR
jgi:hypothetical protein